MDGFLIFLGIIAGLLVYFIPSIIAEFRRHKNEVPILLVNLLLGWSFIGYVIALVWAFTDNVKEKKVVEPVPNITPDIEELRNVIAGLKKEKAKS